MLGKVPQPPGDQQVFPHGPDHTINRSWFSDELILLHRKEKQKRKESMIRGIRGAMESRGI